MNARKTASAVLMAGALGAFGAGGAAAQESDGGGFKTTIKPYLKGVPGSGFQTEPLLSAGDRVPELGNPSVRYQMVGIPDGLGATQEDPRGNRGHGRSGRDEDAVRVYMNHELTQSTLSHPRSTTAELQRGAFVSEYLLTEDGGVLAGRRAFDTVFQDDTLVGPAATTTSATPAFSRFCSGYLGGSDVGLDRPIYFTGEETSGRVQENGNFSAESFDRARGSQTVAIFQNDNGDREAHALSDFGFFPKENTVIVPGTGNKTVAFSTEDGPQTPDSQLYMYVGEKQRSGTVLQRNGLVGGKLYVLAGDDPARNSEATFENGTTGAHWVEIPKSQRQNEVQQEAAADAAGAFGFVRIEDGAIGASKGEFNFVTTGDSADRVVNRLGMDYRLRYNPNQKPENQHPTLSVVYNADQVDAAGQDTAFSPDNTAVTGRVQAIQEDGTGSSRPEMEQRNRDGSVWLVDGGFTSALPGGFPPRKRIAELVGRAEGGRDGIRTSAGVWESSGIIEVSDEFESGDKGGLLYLLDVQAHRPTTPPGGVTETVEDGQLLFLKGGAKHSDDD